MLLVLCPIALLATGCHLVLPEVTHQPYVHNPFPQFSKVAVLPFFNQSSEPTVDGRQFALAYYAELQEIRGFEVVPFGVTESMARDLRTDLSNPASRRQLADALGVDVLVVGSVTDFSPYYPPRCGMRVDWYAANAGFHEVPAGYGLPWGTPQEEFIDPSITFDAEMALAREQMATQSPDVIAALPAMQEVITPNANPELELHRLREPARHRIEEVEAADPFDDSPVEGPANNGVESLPSPPSASTATESTVKQVTFDAPIDETRPVSPGGLTTAPTGDGGTFVASGGLPVGWPDARGFTPPGPVAARPLAKPHNGPVISHTRIFRGSDTDFTAALASYVGFQDDARSGGWESYLDRSDDFIRFCCHLHLTEMLSARGGGGETRVVRRWSDGR